MRHWRKAKTISKVVTDLIGLFLYTSGFIHALLLIFFLILHLRTPALLCMGGLLVCSCMLVIHKRHRSLALVIAQIEICLCSILLTLITGWDSGFYLYIIGMLAGMSFMGHTSYTRIFPLQAMGFASLGFILATRSFTAEHLNGLDAAMDSLYNPLFAVNLLTTAFVLTIYVMLFSRELTKSQQKLLKTNEQLKYLATHDELTGLPNRRSMNELLLLCRAQAERSSIPFTVAIGDIDNFKSFNDTYGHNYGDQVLTLLAETIQCSTREGDFVCRWGGEEILILFSATQRDAARVVLLRVQEKLRHPSHGCQNILLAPVTMTFGLSEYQPGQSISELIQNADEKLYQGKSNGKNCITG